MLLWHPERVNGRRVRSATDRANGNDEPANAPAVVLPGGMRAIVLASPSHAKLSVVTRSLVGIRSRYLQPYEDHVLAG